MANKKKSTTTTRIPQQQTGAMKNRKGSGWTKGSALIHHGEFNWDVPTKKNPTHTYNEKYPKKGK